MGKSLEKNFLLTTIGTCISEKTISAPLGLKSMSSRDPQVLSLQPLVALS